MNKPKPLANFPVVRSHDVEEVREAIARIYAKPILFPSRGTDRIDAVFNNCRLQSTDVTYASYGAAVQVEYPPTEFFSVLFPINGAGEIASGGTAVALRLGVAVAIPAGRPHRATLSADYEHLVLRISARRLTEKLQDMIAAPVDKPLAMAAPQQADQPAARMLQYYLPLFIDTLSAAAPPFPEAWIAQTEQFLMALFLCGFRHTYSCLLEQDPPDPAPREVQRAEAYLEANAHRTVGVTELAKVAGLDVFRLDAAFRKYRGISLSTLVSRSWTGRGGN